jgi:putative ABC transport system ATP-binding protein
MSLLELRHVSKSYRRRSREVVALRDVSFELHPNELVAIWGLRGSGRSTLLRLAAGIEAPDCGVVRFNGCDLSAGIPRGLAYCRRDFHAAEQHPLLEELIASQLAQGRRLSGARQRAFAALERVDACDCAEAHPQELEAAEAVRVSIAIALMQEPMLMLIDEPTTNVDLRKRDTILGLLRSLVEDGVSILVSVGSGTGLFGADRALALSEGELHGHMSPELAPVVQLPLRQSG